MGRIWHRLFGLVVEWAVNLRRVLIWLAPFIGLGYIVFDVMLTIIGTPQSQSLKFARLSPAPKTVPRSGLDSSMAHPPPTC